MVLIIAQLPVLYSYICMYIYVYPSEGLIINLSINHSQHQQSLYFRGFETRINSYPVLYTSFHD